MTSDPFGRMYVPQTQRGLAGNIFLWIVGGLVVVLALTAAVWGWKYVTASTRGKVQAQQQIQSGSSRIAAYNHFFDLCASVQGLEGQLAAQVISLQTATGDDRGRIEANIAGIRGARAQAVAEYNADAQKSYTIGQFRSSKLPYQLPATYTEGTQTSCVG